MISTKIADNRKHFLHPTGQQMCWVRLEIQAAYTWFQVQWDLPSLFCDVTQSLLVVTDVSGQLLGPKMSATNYQSILRNTSAERRCHLKKACHCASSQASHRHSSKSQPLKQVTATQYTFSIEFFQVERNMYNWHDNRKQIQGSVCQSKKHLDSLWNAFIAYCLKIGQGRTVSRLKQTRHILLHTSRLIFLYRPVVTICTAQWSLYVPHSGHYMYRTVVTISTASFSLQNFYVLPIQCIYVFCVDLRTNSDYFPTQH
jgi:hypothetical protein